MKVSKISKRANRILNFFLFAFLCIGVRVWYLSVVTFDDHYESSRAPQRRTVTERAERGTIRDRFNIPLASNAIQYNASICYADIRQIPSVQWEKGPDGKKKRVLARRNYIEKLSRFLGSALTADPQTIEDTIHGRASLFPHTPFVLKEDISEELYCQLKIREKDWLGLQMEQTSKRVYPLGKVGCDIIGYLGAISQREYVRVAQERKELKIYLEEINEGRATLLPKGFSHPQEVQERLSELEKMAYSINDQVGKSGVEASFDEVLRGVNGKKYLATNKRERTQHELPGGQSAQPGERVILSISAALQEEAEKLLAEYEDLQDERDNMGPTKRRHPRVRGGAIVAMLPKTGEVLALASHPRFDPNDLVPAKSFAKRMEKRSAIIKWLESESHIGEIWDGIAVLEEERFSSSKGTFYTEETPLTWDLFLETILPDNGSLRKAIDRVSDVEIAAHLQTCFEALQKLSKDPSPASLLTSLYAGGEVVLSEGMERWKRELDPFLEPITSTRDQLLFLDLLRLVVYKEAIPSGLLERIGEHTLSDHFLYAQVVSYYRKEVKELARKCFHEGEFQEWRETNFKQFLRQKRQEERKRRRYAKPYLEYLEREEQKMFQTFWAREKKQLLLTFLGGGEATYREEILALRQRCSDPLLNVIQEQLQPMTKEEGLAYLATLRSFADLNRPCLGKYPHVKKIDGVQLEKHLAASFYPYTGYGYGRSQAFRQASPMGSVFKLIPAYAGLKQQFQQGSDDLNPFTVVDDMKWTSTPGSNSQILGQHIDGTRIKRFYKGGRLPRAFPGIGKIDLIGAIERSSNLYFSLLAGDVLNSPSDLLDAASAFGLGKKTGIELPGEYQGNLPSDVLHNKTGLYSFAIGQHSLVATPLQAATALCTIANGGKLLQPQIVKLSIGKKPISKTDPLFSLEKYPYKESLSHLGISFPLFTESLSSEKKGYIHYHAPNVRENIFLPKEIQSVILEGMHQVTNGTKGSARVSRIRHQFQNQDAMRAYRKLHPQMVGKTGTAEILYKQTIDAETHAEMDKHVWFLCISYDDEGQTEPELVIAVYLRFGSAGKQGAPIAARLIEKWREIKSAYE
ncbi:MAG: Penicillin-binding protein 2 [Chlamydiae bacterium]|nr:Penicillin-binding protein 2 [Chlamydiota bacterium]